MRIPLHLIFQRQVGTCPSGQNYYNCAVSGFIGCCSVDPCTSGCPAGSGNGNGSSSSSSAVGSTTSTSTAVSSIVTAPGPVSISNKLSSATGSVSSRTNSTPSKTASTRSGETTSIASSASQTAASNSATSAPSSSSSTPIGLIAGMVVLGVIILILIIVLFFYRRRRSSSSDTRESSPKRFRNFFSRMSLTSPLLAAKTGASPNPDSPESATKSPAPPRYADDEKATPVLDSNPIHELASTTRRDPVELAASTPVRAARSDPAHQHATSYAEAGAEHDEVGALIGNLASKDRLGRRPVPRERESWASGATGASTEAVVGGDALGIRNPG